MPLLFRAKWGGRKKTRATDARDWWKIHARADELELMLLEFPHRDSIPIISN
jgi:hypothetical protein